MSKTIRRPVPVTQDRVEAFRRQRGVERRVHFDTGGTPSSWRGTHQVIADASKEFSRNFCRVAYVADEDEVGVNGPDDDWHDHMGSEE